jgi:hypothetical protein
MGRQSQNMTASESGLGLQRIHDRSLGFLVEPNGGLREPLKARAEGLGAHQGTQLRRVGCCLVGDIYLLRICVRHSPISTGLQRRGHSLEEIEPGLSRFAGPMPGVQPGNDQVWPGIGIQEVVPSYYRHSS